MLLDSLEVKIFFSVPSVKPELTSPNPNPKDNGTEPVLMISINCVQTKPHWQLYDKQAQIGSM